MYRYLIMLLCFFVMAFDTRAKVEEHDLLEPITPENASWLVPLETIGTGRVRDIAWLPHRQRLAVEVIRGVWVFETSENNGHLTLHQENASFYPGLTNLTTDPTHSRLIALEPIPDLRSQELLWANIWDVSMGKVVVSIPGLNKISALSPDGLTVASVKGSYIELYSLENGHRIEVVAAPANINGIGFSHDGRYLAITGENRGYDWISDVFFMIYDRIEKLPAVVIEPDDETQVDTAVPYFSPDGTFIAIAGYEHIFQYWQFDSVHLTLTDITDHSESLGIHAKEGMITWPDGSTSLVTNRVSTDGYHAAIVWPEAPSLIAGSVQVGTTNEPSSAINFPEINSIYYQPDGTTLYYGGVKERIGSIETLAGTRLEPRSYPVEYFGQALSPDGLISVSYEPHANYSVVVTDFRRSDGILHTTVPNRAFYPVISDNFKRLVYRQHGPDSQLSDGMMVVDIATGEVIAELPPSKFVTLSFDGRLGASAANRENTLIWDIDNQKILQELQTATDDDFATQLHAFSPDSSRIAVYIEDRGIRLWEVKTGKVIADIPEDKQWYISTVLRFSQDGKWLMLVAQSISSEISCYFWHIDDLINENLPERGYSLRLTYLLDKAKGQYVEVAVGENDTGSPVSYGMYYEHGFYLRFVEPANNKEFARFVVLPWEGALPPSYMYGNKIWNVGRKLYAQNNGIYDGATEKLLHELNFAYTHSPLIRFSPDNHTVATLGEGIFTIWGVPVQPNNPAEVWCPEAPSPQLHIGQQAIATATTGPRELRVRTYPSGIVAGSVPSGTVVKVVRGPICANGLLWWGIQSTDGALQGWSAEAITHADYLLAPLSP